MSNMSLDDSGEMKKQGFEKEPSWDDKIKWFEIPDDSQPYDYRFVAKAVFYAQHWVQTRKKDGTAGKAFPALCKNYDSETSKYFDNGCKYCAFMDLAFKALYASERGKPERKDENGKVIRPKLPDFVQRMNRRTTMATNAIIRELQKSGAPSNNAAAWSYVKPIRLPQGTSDKIVDLQVKFGAPKPDGSGKFGFSHKDFGKDINITFNSQAKTPGGMYEVVVGPKDPIMKLSDEEIQHIQASGALVDFVAQLRGKYPKDDDCEDALRKFGFYDWLDKMNSAANLNQIERSAPAQQTQTAAPATSASAGMLDDGGGLTHSSGVQPKAEAQILQSREPEEDDVPNFAPLETPKAAAPAPTQAAPVAAPTAAPAPVAAPANDLQGKLEAFAGANGKTLQVSEQTFADASLKFYKAGMNVPTCFTKYSANDKPTCKKCPIRLDCMMTDN